MFCPVNISRRTGTSCICHDRNDVPALLRFDTRVSTLGRRWDPAAIRMLTREIQIYVCDARRITVGMNQTFIAFTKERERGWGALKIFYEGGEGS